jgi:hypothetical protein
MKYAHVPRSASAPSVYSQTWMNSTIDNIFRIIGMSVQRDSAVDSIMLLSPGGKVFAVRVDDNGVLTTSEVPLGRG